MMMKNARERVLDYIKEQAAQGRFQVVTSDIAEDLSMQRSNVSAILNQLEAEGKVEKTKTRPVYYSLKQEPQAEDVFQRMVGATGSLSNSVQLAKAAVLYPSRSLNTLIIGNKGTGKSYLAHLMYEFAKQRKVISQQAEFYKINCRHFVNDPARLTQILFGKSDFAGTTNLFDLAENSILFIDNIDYLDGVSLQNIISYLESGNYYYQGDPKPYSKHVTLIIAIDRLANLDIIQALVSKIPIRIELPDLSQRGYQEKFQLITAGFQREALSTRYKINVDPEVIKALLMVENPYNVKYLLGVIKIAVANAYLRCHDSTTQSIRVVLDDFDKQVRDALIRCRSQNRELEAAIPENFTYVFSQEPTSPYQEEDGQDFYGRLHAKSEELRKKGLDKQTMDAILHNEIIRMITNYQQHYKRSAIDYDQLSNVVDPRIIEIVNPFMERCSQLLSVQYETSTAYGLCLHLNAVLRNRREQKVLSAEKIDEIRKANPKEFEQASLLADEISRQFNKTLSIDEVALITMFLVPQPSEENIGNPQILIAMHGDGTAKHLANVINDLVKANNTYAYDMSLRQDSESAYQELKAKIQEIDQGQGVIVMYDMGSLRTILERITEELDVEIRLLYMPITLIGIDLSRKATMEHDIDRIYHEVLAHYEKDVFALTSDKVALVTLCHTGEGGAQEIKRYIQENYRSDIKIYALSQSDRKALIKEVQKIRKWYRIKAFIGTFDPKLLGIPFIPVARIFEDQNRDLDLLLSRSDQEEISFEKMYQYVYEELGIDKEKLRQTLPVCLEQMDEFFGLDVDSKVGLFLHLGVMIHRLIHRQPTGRNQNTARYEKQYKADMNQIRHCLRKIEKTFQIVIPDDEVANLFEIVKRSNQS